MTPDQTERVRKIRDIAIEAARKHESMDDGTRELFISVMEDDALFEKCYGSELVLRAARAKDIPSVLAILMEGTVKAVSVLRQSTRTVN